MSTERRVLVLDGVKPLHDRLISQGIKVTLFTRDSNFRPEDAKRGYEAVVALPSAASVDSWIELARVFHARAPFERVISFHDDDQLRAVALAAALGLPTTHTEEAVIAGRDKARMRELLAGAGVDPTRWQVVSSPCELPTIARTVGFPCIVKPIDGVASKNVSLVRDSADLARLERSLEASGSARYLAEEFHSGPEFSVEGFSAGGRHYILGVTQKFLFEGSFVEMGHVFPAPLTEVSRRRIVEFVDRALTALGITDGPTHTEVRYTGTGELRVIETHTRPGGDRISELVQKATGADLFDLTVRYALGESGAVETILREAVARGYGSVAAVRFARADEPGAIMAAVEGLEAGRAREGVVALDVLKPAGSALTRLESSFDRTAVCLAEGGSAEEAWERATAGLGALRFTSKA